MWAPGQPNPGCQCNRQGYKLVEKHLLGVLFSTAYWDKNTKALQSHQSLNSTWAERRAVDVQKCACVLKDHWALLVNSGLHNSATVFLCVLGKTLCPCCPQVKKEPRTSLSIGAEGQRHQVGAGAWEGKSEGGTGGPQRVSGSTWVFRACLFELEAGTCPNWDALVRIMSTETSMCSTRSQLQHEVVQIFRLCHVSFFLLRSYTRRVGAYFLGAM